MRYGSTTDLYKVECVAMTICPACDEIAKHKCNHATFDYNFICKHIVEMPEYSCLDSKTIMNNIVIDEVPTVCANVATQKLDNHCKLICVPLTCTCDAFAFLSDDKILGVVPPKYRLYHINLSMLSRLVKALSCLSATE